MSLRSIHLTAVLVALAVGVTLLPGVGSAAEHRRGTAIKLASSQVGQALFDSEDQAVYLFNKERGKKPRCYGKCAKVWPPVRVGGGKPVAKGAVKQRLLGTTRRRDGSRQLTYGGHPLYYYAHEGPRQLFCHDVREYGGLWLALDESGDPLSRR